MRAFWSSSYWCSVVIKTATVAAGFDFQGQGDNKFDNTNPKQEILTLGKGTFEIAEPMFLASWQHGYAVGPSDHQIYLTVNPEWEVGNL
eukprot:COSAG01_NODE_19390_length_1012_cov_2.319825_2_plen_89_part_00